MDVHFEPAEDLVLPLRAALKRRDEATEEWTEATLALAALVAEARRRQPGNREFGYWLVENDLDIGHQDRAALINIAEHPDLFRDVVATTGRSSLQLIWSNEMRPRLTSASKTDAPPAIAPETASLTPETHEPAASMGSNSVGTSPEETALMARSPLAKHPKAALVLEHIRQKNTRVLLGKLVAGRGGRAIWELLIEAIETGAFGPPSAVSVTGPSLRLVLPWASSGYASKFDLRQPESRALIRQEVFPVVAAQREQLRRTPERLADFVYAVTSAKLEAARERQLLERRAAAAGRVAREEVVIMYGLQLWPWADTSVAKWSFLEAREAAWFFHVVQPFLHKMGMSADEQAQVTNLLLKWTPLHESGWADAVRQIALAYSKRPTAPCQMPMIPVNHGLI
jgi:hypothetical protein